MSGDILFICGTLNQSAAMHQISRQLHGYNCFFTPYYADGVEALAAKLGLLSFSVLGGKHYRDTVNYLESHRLPVDYRGGAREYDLVVTCSDLIVQKNIRGKRVLLIQDGITEPETWLFKWIRSLKLPRYLANTAALGLSDAYDVFCVASAGYRKLFIKKGVRPDKIVVTGLPNFDDLASCLQNDFPKRDYVLVATSPLRESFRRDDRDAFILKCVQIAAGRPMIFKLHPTENFKRAAREIRRWAPEALIYNSGDINPMIANASVVITQQSTCTYVALALGKELYTNLNVEELKRLMPVQNGGKSAARIAELCLRLLDRPLPAKRDVPSGMVQGARRAVRTRTTLTVYRIGELVALDLRVGRRGMPSIRLLIPWPSLWRTRWYG